MNNTLNFFIDVDDTLVRTYGNKRIPMPATIAHLKHLRDEGALLYCWSSGGARYAENTAIELGIQELFVGFLPKPQVIIDDVNIAHWKNCIQVHPNTCASKSLQDYQTQLAEPLL